MASGIPSIVGVHVQSGIYDAGCNISLFGEGGKKTPRASIIFGHNGSGKSTIAKEIAAIARGEGDGYFYSSDFSQLALNEDEAKRIRVFNEEYIDSKTRIEDDGLDAIVMLGEQVSAAEEIDRIDAALEPIGKRMDESERRKAELSEGPKSAAALEEKAKSDAKKGGWSDRRARVLGARANLTASCWSRIKGAIVNDSRSVLDKRFQDGLVTFEKVKEAGNEQLLSIDPIDEGVYDEQEVLTLLNRVVEQPELSERELRILEIAQAGYQNMVESAEGVFASEATSFCPMCQQAVSREYKESIVVSIRKVLSKEVDEYKAALQRAAVPPVELIEAPMQVSDGARQKLRKAQEVVGALIAQCNKRIVERANSVYSQGSFEPLGLSSAVGQLNEAIKAVNAEIASINEAVINKEKIKDDLLKINDQLAYLDARVNLEGAKQSRETLEKVEASIKADEEEHSKLLREKDAQEARMRQIHIAIEVINAYLANVYFDSERFKLVLDEGRYKVKSHGDYVRPKDISTGERNILALSYFFSECGENKKRSRVDWDVQYIVLDDPVSSFDMENRIGVCSLIRERSEHILGSNPDSRITILTHDASVVDELHKVYQDIWEYSPIANSCTNLFRIGDGGTLPMGIKASEYTMLLNRAYDFATSTEEDVNESYVIGNILRRILEGYSTFNYCIGMSGLSRDEELFSRFGDQMPLLSSVMYRLALNGESHMEQQVKAFNPANSFERYSYEEKKKCAQCVMVILNKLDSVHVKKQLEKHLPKRILGAELDSNVAEWEKRFASQTF